MTDRPEGSPIVEATCGTMTDDELSRWIADHIEPSISLPDPDTYVETWGSAKGTICWRTAYLLWEPRDMVNDPAMTVMLLEKLAATELVEISTWNGEYEVVWCWGLNDGSENITVRCPHLGRAVAEAFAMTRP